MRCLLAPLLALSTSLSSAQAPAPKAPVTLRSLILSQLRSTHNKAEWFVPANTAVAGLTPEQANWIPPQTVGKTGEHSVGQLTYHLVFWNENVLNKLRDPKYKEFSGNNDETFTKFDAASWTSTVQRLDKVMTELEDFVEHADDAKLNAAAQTLAHVGTHNAYHTGQIIFVRKLQGSWNPDNGVK